MTLSLPTNSHLSNYLNLRLNSHIGLFRHACILSRFDACIHRVYGWYPKATHDRSIHREKSRGDLSKKTKKSRLGGGPRKRIERNGAGARLQHSVGRPFGPSTCIPRNFRCAHASCSRPCAPLPSFRALSMPPFSSRHLSSRRRRVHRNPFGKVGGKISFLVIPRGIPRVDHARRSV